MFIGIIKQPARNGLISLTIVLLCITTVFTEDISSFLGVDVNEQLGDDDEAHEYTTDVAIKLKPEFADDFVSDLFAESHNLEKIARVTEFNKEDGLFHFKLNDIPFEEADNLDESVERYPRPRHRSKRHVDDKVTRLRADDRVEYVVPQRSLSRHKRRLNEGDLEELLDFVYKRKNLFYVSEEKQQSPSRVFSVPDAIDFNDHNFKQQWYLINEGQLNTPAHHDLNVEAAWLAGYTGKNVTIVIVDDGLDYEHPDFAGKYRADLSYDYNDVNDSKHDPMPRTFDSENNHGTRCAGAAVAHANNSVCGVGVAYDAQIGGIRILDGRITDLLEARALSYQSKLVDIRSASWGPRDDGAHMEYPGKFVNMALEEGVKNGRNGKGTLFVWASGNGGGNGDDCSADGYVSHWNIISIGSINHHGLSPYFMELCPSTMAVVYSGGQVKQSTRDKDDPGVRVIASDVRGQCTMQFQGTSSAAPLASGALALLLEANGNLTYRDVMHLIAKTARVPNIEDTEGWQINGANYHVNEKYGFGVLDVAQMVQEAQGWRNVAERQRCVIEYDGEYPRIHPTDAVQIILTVSHDNCAIDELEHVVANISLSFPVRGDIQLTLVSPADTSSEILSYRDNDKSPKGIVRFPFMTLFNWGESPVGRWKLLIDTRTPASKPSGQLLAFSLNLFGTINETPTTKTTTTRGVARTTRAFTPSDAEIHKIYESEFKLSRQTRIIDKRTLATHTELQDILNQ